MRFYCQRTEKIQITTNTAGTTHSNRIVLNPSQLSIDIILSLPIFEQLAQSEQRRPFKEQFRNNTPGTEDVHRLGHDPIALPKRFRRIRRDPRLLGANLRIRAFGVEPLGGDVACAPAGGVEVERKVGGVVEGEVGGFV